MNTDQPAPATLDLSVLSLREAYRSGAINPDAVIDEVLRRCDACEDPAVWITRLSREELQPYLDALRDKGPDTHPLFGVPFAIKDNIDLAAVPTTAGCPAFARIPEESAFVVERLITAGAIPMGKTNLDQFATGLTGTRSPYGAVKNSFDPAFISGGSSSGSAVAVARGLVGFSLGTDTAGSGRVPAAFNNLVGIKPTRGLLSTRGVLPACRTLDCVNVFALDMSDADAVMAAAAVFDPADPYARRAAPGPHAQAGFRFGVPRELEFFGDRDAERIFAAAAARLASLGGDPMDIDFAPFLSAARLLYEGPWVAERYAAIQAFIETKPDALYPVTRAIIEPGSRATAVAAFRAQYRLAELKRETDALLSEVDLVLTPTAGTIYPIAAVESDPIRLNSNLGYYTNFLNLLDYAGVAVPAGLGANGLPYGVTLFGPAHADALLATYGDRLHHALGLPSGATGHGVRPMEASPAESGDGLMRLVVCGAHMSGLPLSHQLTEREGRLVHRCRTAPKYRLYALPGGPPHRPGLVRQAQGGEAIEVEVWALPERHFGSFVQAIPAPLAIGTIELDDGTVAKGFVCEDAATRGARDITLLGGWRAFRPEG